MGVKLAIDLGSSSDKDIPAWRGRSALRAQRSRAERGGGRADPRDRLDAKRIIGQDCGEHPHQLPFLKERW